jgi:hypothetical protein
MNADKPSLHAALIEARKAIPAIPKTAKNPHFGNSYAPLGAILEAVLPVLHAHGLSLTARVEISGGGQPVLEVLIVQADGDGMLASQVPLLGATDMQKLGGAMTYALRYAVGSLLALELEDDDDGNRASAPSRATSAGNRSNPPQGTVSPVGTPQVAKPAPAGSCPKCGKVGAIIESKYGGGWLCYWKKGGCGGKFTYDPRKVPAKQADDFLAPVRQPAQQTVPDEDGPPPFDPDDPRALPF